MLTGGGGVNRGGGVKGVDKGGVGGGGGGIAASREGMDGGGGTMEGGVWWADNSTAGNTR